MSDESVDAKYSVNSFIFITRKYDIKKETAIKALEEMKSEFTLDEYLDRLILLDKIDVGNNQSENNHTVSEAELEKEMGKWFK